MDIIAQNNIIQRLNHLIFLAQKKCVMGNPYIIGITGPPGVGKTTVASILLEAFASTDITVYTASLEDYYFPKDKRIELGIKWRAAPGSHDIMSLLITLANIKGKKTIEYIPRYCMVNDRPLDPIKVCSIINCFILEGWFLNTHIQKYRFISKYIDYLIYLDADLCDVKKWRYQREEFYRVNYHGGYSHEQMNEFWDSLLEPGINNWVIPQKSKADLILRFDENHHLQ